MYPILDWLQEVVSATEEEAKKVQALRDGEVDKAVKSAATSRDHLSKELVQATSELTNKKTALETELKALEALKKVRALQCDLQRLGRDGTYAMYDEVHSGS